MLLRILAVYETLEQARKEGVTILSTDMSAFEASGRIFEKLKI